MNDNTSNTPDNASRLGKARPRDEHGRFLSRQEILDREHQHQAEAARAMDLEKLNNAVEDLTIEQFENLPLAGSNGELTVGEFLAAADKMVTTGKSLSKKLTRIGHHVDVPNKNTNGHTRRPKREKKNNEPVDVRRNMMYQIRTLPGNRGYGLYYADGVKSTDPFRGSKDIVRHWLGENWYPALSDGPAKVFTTPDEARKFRRDHFSVKMNDDDVRNAREARRERNKVFRLMGGNRHARTGRITEKKNVNKRERKVREDLVKLYSLIGRTH